MKPFGHFDSDSYSYIVDQPDTPRAFDNFMWNDSIFSCVQQTGVGYCDTQVNGLEGVKLYTGEGRICDIEVFGRETLLSRLVYIRDNDTGDFWNIGWEPVRHEYESFACEHGLGFSRVTSTVSGIEGSILVFVPAGSDPVESWKIELRNNSGRPRNLSVFILNQYGLQYKSGFNSYGDMLYRGAWMDEDAGALIVQKHPFIAPHNYLTAYLAADRRADGYDGSRDCFAGLYCTLAAPRAVVEGKCTNTPGSDESTIGAMQFNIALADGAGDALKVVTGITDSVSSVPALKEKHLGGMEAEFDAMREEKARMTKRNEVKTPDPQFNRLFNAWMKEQTLYGAIWGRWGWMGYRDVVQHAWGASSFSPSQTKKMLSAALEHLRATGLAIRGWNPVDTKNYSDSAVWLVYTLCDYIKETGDFAYLDEKLDFFEGGSGTVFEHIVAALDYLEGNKGAHGLLLIKFGDWNDSLTGIGKEGKGESVWLTMATIHALHLFSELCSRIDRASDAKKYASRADALTEATRSTAWDGKWFVRCFDDQGKPVGSAQNEEGRIYVNAQSWAIISGVASRDQIRDMLESCDKLLATPHGYRLLVPPYLKRDDHIGRISYMEPGICENGTIYSHCNAFLFNALLRDKQADRAYETFKRVTPGYVDDASEKKYAAPPYVYANCYFGPEHRNRAFIEEFTWITGSVAWFINSALDFMLGVRREYDGLTVDPQLPSEWSDVEFRREFRGKQFNIRMRRTGSASVTLNGRLLSGSFISILDCAETNAVLVTF